MDGVARRVIVHRKGATPAAEGVLGIIPGSMAAQSDLVDPLGRFDPRLVKMAPEGEKPED